MQSPVRRSLFCKVPGVRFQLGTFGCLLAGCVVQPTASAPTSAIGREGDPALAVVKSSVPPATFALRIGVEHLPPATDTDDEPPRCERLAASPVAAARREAPREALRDGLRDGPRDATRPDGKTAPALLAMANTDDPLARETVHFVNDLIETDRRRVAREVGLPFFDFHAIDPDRGPLLASEVQLREDHEEWVHQNGTLLLKRPFRQMLRRLPIVQDLEVEFEDFRSDHVPWTAPYEATHNERRQHLGRISLRVHAGDLDDPVEVVWINSGLRIGSSQGIGKLGFELPLSDKVHLDLRGRTEYDTGEIGLRLDLAWRRSESTSVHLAIGDDMDFLTTSSLYSLFESPMDGAPGLVLYAVHVF
jgi:hypothetical protein